MSQTSRNRFKTAAPPDLALEVLKSADFEIEQQIAHGTTKSASVREVSKSDASFVYEIDCVEYGKGLTGIDRSKTEESKTTVRWNLTTRQSEWEYVGKHGKRVRIWGASEVRADGEGSEVISELHVEVKMPLVGGKIEKIVKKETEAFWPEFQQIFERHVEATRG